MPLHFAASHFSKPFTLNALFLLAFSCFIGSGIFLGKGGDSDSCMRMFLLALLLSAIGSAANLVMVVRMGLGYRQKLAVAYLLGFVLLFLLSWLLRTIIIRIVAFDLPAAMLNVLVTGAAPDGRAIRY